MPYKRKKTAAKTPAKVRVGKAAKTPKPTHKPTAPVVEYTREPITEDREGWLLAASQHLGRTVRAAQVSLGQPLRNRPPPAVSFGYAPGSKTALHGSVVDPTTDQTHIYLSPSLGTTGPTEAMRKSVEVLAALLHELIHDAVGHEHGHQRYFKTVCDYLGMIGYADSQPGLRLGADLEKLVVHHLGPCPHKAVAPGRDAPGHRRQRNRQRKYVCRRCGQIIRSGSDNLVASHHCTNGMIGRFVLDN